MISSRPIHVMESRSRWLRGTSSYLRFAARNGRDGRALPPSHRRSAIERLASSRQVTAEKAPAAPECNSTVSSTNHRSASRVPWKSPRTLVGQLDDVRTYGEAALQLVQNLREWLQQLRQARFSYSVRVWQLSSGGQKNKQVPKMG